VQQAQDNFGNVVLDVYAERVEQAIDFTAWIVVERDATAGLITVTADEWADPGLREPSPLTTADAVLLQAADDLASHGEDPLTLARRINAWVHAQITYEHGPTGVKTTAAEAFALRRGVCQDYAHVMLALSRRCGLAARYVSGHLLGEGGTHAWVEVLLPGAEGTIVAHPFDPTNETEPGLKYITVAVGRDYRDVAPACGSFRASYPGRLSASKRAGVTALEYFSSPT
ncbi:MAG: transglutaminase family protein, partial [Chloroflexota bacterium]|nr:transglutaminase family protein [Chloroflexota bacterium]